MISEEINASAMERTLDWVNSQLESDESVVSRNSLNKIKEQLESGLSILRGEEEYPRQQEILREETLGTNIQVDTYVQPPFSEDINTPRMRDPIQYNTEAITVDEIQEVEQPPTPSPPTDTRRVSRRRIVREEDPIAEITSETESPSRFGRQNISRYLVQRNSPLALGETDNEATKEKMIDAFATHGMLMNEEIPWDEFTDEAIKYYAVFRHPDGNTKKAVFIYCDDEEEQDCHLHTAWTQGQSLAFGQNEPYAYDDTLGHLKLKARDRVANWAGGGGFGRHAMTKESMSAYYNLGSAFSSRSRTILNNNWRNQHEGTELADYVAVFRSPERNKKTCEL